MSRFAGFDGPMREVYEEIIGGMLETFANAAKPKRGRGKSKKSVELVDAAHAILDEIQPASVRAVCYQLFIRKLIRSMAKNETNKVSRQLVWAREQGIIPWEWVVDETREAERANTWSNPEEIIDAAVKGYRKNYWQAQPHWVEVWSEKGTVRGTLAPILNDYGVTFRVMHGYSSATALQAVARETELNPKPLTILYVGDWDPSGLHMSEVDIPGRLERYSGTATVRRVALQKIDVETGDLPHFEAGTKKSDPRYQWFTRRYGQRCWELDAMAPPDLRDRVEEMILDYLDVDAWDHAKKVEAAETESMREVMETWKRISRQAPKYSGGE